MTVRCEVVLSGSVICGRQGYTGYMAVARRTHVLHVSLATYDVLCGVRKVEVDIEVEAEAVET
jgi:hypothetical protein